jgi:N-glycosylase/DNA lyase
MLSKSIKFHLVSKPYVNGLFLRYYKNFNVNSKSKKGHNSVKMHDRVTSSCLQVWVMTVNRCAKFQSHMSMDFENIRDITKIKRKSKKGHNSIKMLDTVTSPCLQVWVMTVNRCAKFQSHMSMDFENI